MLQHFVRYTYQELGLDCGGGNLSKDQMLGLRGLDATIAWLIHFNVISASCGVDMARALAFPRSGAIDEFRIVRLFSVLKICGHRYISIA